mgnify:FL=1
MNEQDRFKKQLLKHTLYNICAFAIIFSIFGILIFCLVRNITYSSVDLTLKECADIYLEADNNLQGLSNYFIQSQGSKKEEFANSINAMRDYVLSRKVTNPKVIVILRDGDSNVLNSDDLGRNYNEYLAQLDFNKKILNKIYEICINNTYNYRAINLKLDSDSDENLRYIQLLINVDSENELISHYMDIISVGILTGIIMSIIASYILSKKTLVPIANTLKKQMEFVQNASHELRTPLTIIQAKQELLLQEPDAKIIDKSEDIMLTLNETKRLTKLTKDLMILARADENNIKLNKEKVDIDELIDGMAKPYIEMAEFEEKQMKLNLQYEEEAFVDTSKIYQVMVILLDNAIKYTEKGDCIEINTYSKDGKCVIEVKDTGVGISEEAITHIFDRFYREDKARNRETGGSGLGLSIADVIVKAHNGTIKASHNKPKGTIFTIKLPK